MEEKPGDSKVEEVRESVGGERKDGDGQAGGGEGSSVNAAGPKAVEGTASKAGAVAPSDSNMSSAAEASPTHFVRLFHTKKHLSKKQISDLCEKAKVKYNSIADTRAGRKVMVYFDCAEDRERAQTIFHKKPFRGGVLYVKATDATVQEIVGGMELTEARKRQKVEAVGTRDIRDVVTPLWKVPYEEQCKSKKQSLIAAMRRLSKRLQQTVSDRRTHQYSADMLALSVGLGNSQRSTSKRRNPTSIEERGHGGCTILHSADQYFRFVVALGWTFILASKHGTSRAVPFVSIDDFIKSPVTTEYRNKCSFTCGRAADGSVRG